MKTKLSFTLLALLVGVASVSAGAPIVNPVPEAGATIVLLGLGVAAAVALRRKFAPKK
jgi:hypothetical protein